MLNNCSFPYIALRMSESLATFERNVYFIFNMTIIYMHAIYEYISCCLWNLCVTVKTLLLSARIFKLLHLFWQQNTNDIFCRGEKMTNFFSSHQEPKNKKHNFLVLPGMLIDKIKLCVHVFVCLVNLFLSIYNLGSNQSQTRRPTFNNRREHSTNCLIKMTIKMNLLLSTCQTYVHFEFTFIIWNHLFYYQHSHSFENTTQLFDSVFSQCSSMFSFLLLLFSFKRDFTI